MLAIRTAFLWLYSSSSSNNTPLQAPYDPLYPHSFPAKKKYCPFPALGSCRFLFLQKRTTFCAFLLGCILFPPDRLLGLPSPFSELQPRLPERLRALVAWCHPCLWSACSFFNTLQGIQEDSGETRPTTEPHPTWLSSSSPLMSLISLLSIYLRAEGNMPFGFFPAPGFSRGRCGHFVPCGAHLSVHPSVPGAQLRVHREEGLGRAGGFCCECIHSLAWCAIRALLKMSCVYIGLCIYMAG